MHMPHQHHQQQHRSHLYRNKIYFKYNSIKCRFKTHLYRNQHSQSWLCIIWHHSIGLGYIFLSILFVYFGFPHCIQTNGIILMCFAFFLSSLYVSWSLLQQYVETYFSSAYWLPTWSTIFVWMKCLYVSVCSISLSLCLCVCVCFGCDSVFLRRLLHVRIFIVDLNRYAIFTQQMSL